MLQIATERTKNHVNRWRTDRDIAESVLDAPDCHAVQLSVCTHMQLCYAQTVLRRYIWCISTISPLILMVLSVTGSYSEVLPYLKFADPYVPYMAGDLKHEYEN